MIAESLDIDVATAALLSSAYTFPYALVQPALGVTGDFFGKTRLMNLCLLGVAVAALVGHGGRGRTGGGRSVSGRNGAGRRSRAGQSAPGGDRPAAGGRAHGQPHWRLDRGRDRRLPGLARRVRDSPRVP